MSSKTTSAMDKQIADKITALRHELGFSREEVGTLLGITHQQMSKYEKGTNRVSAGRLYQLAEIYGVHISEMFGVSHKIIRRPRLSLELGDQFSKLKSSAFKERIVDLVRAAVKEGI